MAEPEEICVCSDCRTPALGQIERNKESCLICGCTRKTIRFNTEENLKLHEKLKLTASFAGTKEMVFESVSGEEKRIKLNKFVKEEL